MWVIARSETGDGQTTEKTEHSSSLTSLTSSFHTHRGDPHRLARVEFNLHKGGGVPPEKFQRIGVRTGETGEEPRPAPPPWTDDRAWIAEVTRASGRDAKIDKVMAWGRAAGGEITTARDTLGIVLPSGLPSGMALNELRRFARELHIETELAEFTL